MTYGWLLFARSIRCYRRKRYFFTKMTSEIFGRAAGFHFFTYPCLFQGLFLRFFSLPILPITVVAYRYGKN